MSEATEFTEVYCASNLALGDAVRELLARNGIDCAINPSVPTFPWDGDVRVLCTESDAARARELIAAYFAAQPEDEEEEDDDEDDGDDEEEGEDDEEDKEPESRDRR